MAHNEKKVEETILTFSVWQEVTIVEWLGQCYSPKACPRWWQSFDRYSNVMCFLDKSMFPCFLFLFQAALATAVQPVPHIPWSRLTLKIPSWFRTNSSQSWRTCTTKAGKKVAFSSHQVLNPTPQEIQDLFKLGFLVGKQNHLLGIDLLQTQIARMPQRHEVAKGLDSAVQPWWGDGASVCNAILWHLI